VQAGGPCTARFLVGRSCEKKRLEKEVKTAYEGVHLSSVRDGVAILPSIVHRRIRSPVLELAQEVESLNFELGRR
jgi:hypothetical protein